MTGTINNPERIEYRLVMIDPYSMRILAIKSTARLSLPRESIPAYTRVAEALTETIEQNCGLRTIQLAILPGAVGQNYCAVHEIMSSLEAAPKSLSFAALDEIGSSELTESERSLVLKIVKGEANELGRFARLGWIDELLAKTGTHHSAPVKVRYLGASSMKAWEFSKALHLQKANGWTRFVSMQDNYNLLAREEEREMLPLCADEGVQTIVYSPLARGRLTRPWGETTSRSESEQSYANHTNDESDQKIVEAVGAVAVERNISQAQIAFAWLHRNPVIAAPIVGALKAKHIDDAIAALSITLTDEEVARLEAPYTSRLDYQGVSDPPMLARAVEVATGFKATAA